VVARASPPQFTRSGLGMLNKLMNFDIFKWKIKIC
jgi:hypothetical protein